MCNILVCEKKLHVDRYELPLWGMEIIVPIAAKKEHYISSLMLIYLNSIGFGGAAENSLS